MADETPATETPAAQANDSAVISELISDHFPAAEPATTPEPGKATAEEPGTTAADPLAGEGDTTQGADPAQPAEVEVAAPAADGIPRFKFKGKEFSLEDLRKDPKLLTRIVTAAEQAPHFQKLSEERQQQLNQLLEVGLAQARAAQAQPQPQAAPAFQPEAPRPQAPQITPQMVRQNFDPQVKDYAAQGFVEPELAEIYPATAASFVWHANRVRDLENVVMGLLRNQHAGKSEAQRAQFVSYLDSAMDKVVEKGEFFHGLKDTATREKFINEFVAISNPRGDLVTPDFLAQMWVAFNSEAVLTAQQAAAAATIEEKKRTRTLAGGEGRSARPSTVPPVALSGQAAHMADLIEGAIPAAR